MSWRLSHFKWSRSQSSPADLRGDFSLRMTHPGEKFMHALEEPCLSGEISSLKSHLDFHFPLKWSFFIQGKLTWRCRLGVWAPTQVKMLKFRLAWTWINKSNPTSFHLNKLSKSALEKVTINYTGYSEYTLFNHYLLHSVFIQKCTFDVIPPRMLEHCIKILMKI